MRKRTSVMKHVNGQTPNLLSIIHLSLHLAFCWQVAVYNCLD